MSFAEIWIEQNFVCWFLIVFWRVKMPSQSKHGLISINIRTLPYRKSIDTYDQKSLTNRFGKPNSKIEWKFLIWFMFLRMYCTRESREQKSTKKCIWYWDVDWSDYFIYHEKHLKIHIYIKYKIITEQFYKATESLCICKYQPSLEILLIIL